MWPFKNKLNRRSPRGENKAQEIKSISANKRMELIKTNLQICKGKMISQGAGNAYLPKLNEWVIFANKYPDLALTIEEIIKEE